MSEKMKLNGLKYAGIALLLVIVAGCASAGDAQAYRGNPNYTAHHRNSNHGAAVWVLPSGAVSVKVGGVKYHYNHGVFYKKGPWGYSVVRAPKGAVVGYLPRGCKKVKVGGVVYYSHNGVYYKKIKKGYKVVVKPNPSNNNSRNWGSIKEGDKVKVNVAQLNVRKGPGKNFKVKTVVNRNKKMKVVGTSSNWLYVKYSKNKYGWVKTKFVKEVGSSPKG